VYNAEKQLREHGDKLSADDKKALEDAVAEARKDLESDDVASIDGAHRRVEQSLHKLAEVLYKSQGQPGAQGAAGSAPGAGAAGAQGDVIDAEFTEEKGDS
jgi:molecular chaperone DnaK